MTETETAPPPLAPPPSIGRAALISGGARMAAQMITWLVTLLTVRILAPADYGQAGLAMAVVTMAAMLVDLGIGPAIQAMPDQSPVVLRHAHSVSAGIAALVATGLALLSPVLAHFFGDPALRALFVGAAVGCLLEGLRAVPTAVGLRSFQFGLVARADFSRAMVGSIVTVTMAWLGLGAWSLVGGALIASAVSLWVLQRALRLRLVWPDWQQVRQLAMYGRLLLVGRLTWQVWVNADSLMLGRYGTMSALGNFNVAKTFAALPQEKLLSVLMGVSQSYLAARADDPAALRRYLLELTELIAVGMGLPLLGLALTAHDVLPLLLGRHWSDTARLVQWLIPGVFVSCLGVLTNQIVIVRQRADIPTWASTVAALLAVPWYWACMKLAGAPAVAAGTLAIAVLINWSGFREALRQTQTSAQDYLGALRPLALSGSAMVVALWGARLALTPIVRSGSVVWAACLIFVGGSVGVGVAVWSGGAGTERLRRTLVRRGHAHDPREVIAP